MEALRVTVPIFLIGLVSVACSLRASANESKEVNPQVCGADLKALQGQWKVDETESLIFIAQYEVPQIHELNDGPIRIHGDDLRCGKNLQEKFTMVLGEKKGKKTITLSYSNKPPMIGIYELNDGVFKMCFEFIDEEAVKKGELPMQCGRTRLGWFLQFNREKK